MVAMVARAATMVAPISCRATSAALLLRSATYSLNEDFADIITGEPFHVIPPTPEETDDAEHLDLQRLAFGFNRRDYGRLRQLIDVLNQY